MAETAAHSVAGTGGGRSLRRRITGLQQDGRTLVSEHPVLYLPYARRAHFGGAGSVVSADTRILIDGYTRSASTFAVLAFQLAQPEPVRVARHLHAAAGVIAAARRGIPILLCIRPPEPTVLSAVVRQPGLSIRSTLWSYARFYEKVLPYSDACLIGRFEAVTTDFGSVIDSVNSKFGTNFGRFDHSEAAVGEVFGLIEQRSRRPSWAKVLADYQSGLVGTTKLFEIIKAHDGSDAQARALEEKWVARPSEQRRAMKASLLSDYESARMAPLRARAEAAYEAVATQASSTQISPESQPA